MNTLNGLAISWFFAPYVGSADIDFFKRIKDTGIGYTVFQVVRDERDDQLLQYVASPRLDRMEVRTDHRNPRGRVARDEFRAACLYHYERHRSDYDFVISHSNEIPSHAIAREIKSSNPALPWIAYFGDLFIANPYIRYIPGYPLVEEDAATEEATLREADVVILNNEYQKALMFRGPLEAHAHKAVVIPHCFDPAMYGPAPPRHAGPFRFAHLGTLYPTKRTAEPLLHAVERLLAIYPQYKGRFEVVFHGSVASHDISVHAFMKHRSHVRFEEPVGYFESLRLMQEADVLVLIDGIFNEQEDGIDCNPFLAGKLADYMGTGKPIMGITMARGPSADILRESGNLVADERVDRIAYVLKRYIDGKVSPDTSQYTRYASDRVSDMMETAIRRAVQKERA